MLNSPKMINKNLMGSTVLLLLHNNKSQKYVEETELLFVL